MKPRLGISIYPEISGEQATMRYINEAKNNNFQRIFANLLEVENNPPGQAKLQMFQRVWTYARALGFEVIVDVNPLVYSTFQLPPNELKFFQTLGATGIRLDEDSGGMLEATLSHNRLGMKIELNASAGTKTLDQALRQGANPTQLVACHNFYPMRYTGLQYEQFIATSAYLKARAIDVAAFITLPAKQNGIGPWNVNEGMPTIEEHRGISLVSQAKWLLQLGIVRDIIISQQGATAQQMQDLNQLLKKVTTLGSQKQIVIRCKMNKLGAVAKDIIDFRYRPSHNQGEHGSHANRFDPGSYFIRSSRPRLIYKSQVIEPNNAGHQLHKGDIIIVNKNLGRYQGELHIILKSIDDSGQKARNLVGKVVQADWLKLDFIRGGQQFTLKY